jgi:DNA-binding PadR family transcriptional regulator
VSLVIPVMASPALSKPLEYGAGTHTLLYRESARLATQGLLTETRDPAGRRRRVFTITQDGMAALGAWLDQPSSQPTELRDLGLLQHFFTDLAPEESRLRLAKQQLAIHRAKLLAYQHEAAGNGDSTALRKGQRTVEHWRGGTLRMGLRYEAAAVDFWTELIAEAEAPAEAG